MLVVDDMLTTDALSCAVRTVFREFALVLIVHPDDASLPASYWGDSEAGVTGRSIHVRGNTPIHSLLHEACHVVCTTAAEFVRDAGGCDDEESAVCAMQLLLAEVLPGVGAERMARDMDDWGYSFREGSAWQFRSGDGRHALDWLADERPQAWRTVMSLVGTIAH
ncbi:MAG: hypothetical protein AAFN07_06000 [Pseudomonadota bacterium]